jgi:CMP-N-acetylneuraminic acid synthetase
VTKTIVVILARAGSVRLPRKNVAAFLGRPMIGWTFERALALRRHGLADHVVVSTDDIEVQRLAPPEIEVVARPADLATATATSFAAMAHAVQRVEARVGISDVVVLLQPTSPLASAASTLAVVSSATRGIREGRAAAYMAITSLTDIDPDLARAVEARRGSAWRIEAKGNGIRVSGETDADGALPIMRVPDAQSTHVITGATYAVSRPQFFEQEAFFLSQTMGVTVPARESVDIDTVDDFDLAVAIGQISQHQ